MMGCKVKFWTPAISDYDFPTQAPTSPSKADGHFVNRLSGLCLDVAWRERKVVFHTLRSNLLQKKLQE